ncbi:hypothetical protein D3C75_1157260 [compost metagenome]
MLPGWAGHAADRFDAIHLLQLTADLLRQSHVFGGIHAVIIFDHNLAGHGLTRTEAVRDNVEALDRGIARSNFIHAVEA